MSTKIGVAQGGTNMGSYTTGDILYASAAGVLSKLAIGSSGQALTVSGGLPVWGTPGSGISQAYAPLTISGSTIYKRFNVLAYGANPDGKALVDGSSTSGSSTFTSATAAFVSGDAGKIIVIVGVGTSGHDFVGTISSVTNSTTIVLSANAGTSLTGASFIYGTDQTTFIQAAITACWNAGTGTVYIPKGIYLIAGALQISVGGINMNSQLYIPTSATGTSDTLNSIEIVGEGNPNIAQYSIYGTNSNNYNGTVLLSTLTTGATGAAIIGTKGITGAFGSFNVTSLRVRSLNLKMLSNPAGAGPVIGGISYKYGFDIIVDSVSVNPIGGAPNSVQPTNDVSGIEAPDNSSGQVYNITNSICAGLKNGFMLGEHVCCDQVQAFVCDNAYTFKTGHHAVYGGRMGSYWCKNDILFSGAVPVYIAELDNEWYYDTAFLGVKWFSNVYTVNDPSNLATGVIQYNLIKATVGKDNSHFTMNGGTNAGFAIGSLDNPPYVIASRNNTFSGTQTFNNIYATGKIGIGDNSFANDWFLKYSNSGASYNGAKIQNTNSAGVAGLQFMNDNSVKGSIGVLGSAWNFNPSINNWLTIGSDKGIAVSLDASVSSGGTNSFQVYVGGSATTNPSFEVLSTGKSKFGGNYTIPTTAPTTGQYLGYNSSGVADWSIPTNYWTLTGNNIYSNNNSGVGLVGIGTNGNPSYQLDVLGTAVIVARFKSSNTNTQVVLDAPGSSNAQLRIDANAVPKWYVGNDASVDKYRWLNSNANGNAEVATLLQSGRFGLGQTTPTAILHLKAGTATANTAPLKFTSGVVLTTPESGVTETDASNELYYSNSTTTASRGYVHVDRYIAKTGTYTATANDGTINCTANTFTVTLPTAVGIAGRTYTVTNSGAGTITIGTTSSQTFTNVATTPTTLTLAALGFYTVQSDGANWLVISN